MTARVPILLVLTALAVAAALLWASAPDRSPAERVAPPTSAGRERDSLPDAPLARSDRAAVGSTDERMLDAEAALEDVEHEWRVSGDLLDARTGQAVGLPVYVELLGAGGFHSSMTDDAGRSYRVAAEWSGRYVLRTRARGYAPFARDVDLRGAAGARRIDLRLSPARLVLVRARTLDGEDLELAIQAAGLGHADELVAAVTGARPGTRLHARPPRDGEFLDSRFDGTLSGIVRAFPAPPPDAMGVLEPYEHDAATVALVFGQTVVASKPLPAEATELTFAIGLDALESFLASVDLVVYRASDGTPVDARVSVSPFPFLFLTRRTEDGAARFERLHPGRQWLVVEAEGLEQRVIPLDLEPGDRRQMDLALSEGQQLGGVVQDEAGNGVLADVTVLRLDQTPPVVVARRWTEPDGSFSIEGLGSVPHAVVLAGDESSATNSRVLDWVAPSQRVNPPSHVRLRATRGSILFVAREDSDPLPLDIELRDDDDLPVRHDRVGPWDDLGLRLPTGGYTVVVSRGGIEAARYGVQVGGDPMRIVVSP